MAAAKVWRGWGTSLGGRVCAAGFSDGRLLLLWGIFWPGSGRRCGFLEAVVKHWKRSSSELFAEDPGGGHLKCGWLHLLGGSDGTAASVGIGEMFALLALTTSVAEIACRSNDCQECEGDEGTSSKGQSVDEVMVMAESCSRGQDVEVTSVDIDWGEQGMGMAVIFLDVEVLQVDS